MVYLSKSKYTLLWRCPKLLWLKQYKPEEATEDTSVEARLEAGNDFGDLAMGLFGDFVEVTVKNGDRLDLGAMIARTREEMARGTEVICEASFSYDGLYCAVDILRREREGWAIYEVKSSTQPSKEIYAADVAFQRYVLERCGIKVTGTYIVTVNSSYVREGAIDIHTLTNITDVSAEVEAQSPLVDELLAIGKEVLNSQEVPAAELNLSCNEPYPCEFWDYCTRGLPSPSVFDVYRLSFKKMLKLYEAGIVSFSDLDTCGEIKNDKQRRQIDAELGRLETYIYKDGIKDFLAGIYYPLYFLDFESIQEVVPRYDGTRPYQQIPFQYSLHYIEQEDGALCHTEFLGEPEADPRRALAEQLCRDIPRDACVTAYNKSFECSRLKELAEAYPDLAEHLLNIRDHIVDFLEPFRSGYYYKRAMGGSFSIKVVLPALFPDDPTLDYHNLEGVHNGGEAMAQFPALAALSGEERKKARENLLKYCELDTYAMVKLWEKLKEVAE